MSRRPGHARARMWGRGMSGRQAAHPLAGAPSIRCVGPLGPGVLAKLVQIFQVLGLGGRLAAFCCEWQVWSRLRGTPSTPVLHERVLPEAVLSEARADMAQQAAHDRSDTTNLVAWPETMRSELTNLRSLLHAPNRSTARACKPVRSHDK